MKKWAKDEGKFAKKGPVIQILDRQREAHDKWVADMKAVKEARAQERKIRRGLKKARADLDNHNAKRT